MSTAIEFNNISKQYRLGLVSSGTIRADLQRWWTMNIRGKEDPFLKVGETNGRASKGNSEFVWALKDIDFKVEQGDVVGIIGKNGAGKSTLLKILSKVTGPTTGTIKAKGRIGSLLEVGTGFHPEMTGRENIYLNGAILGMNKQEISRKLDEIVDFSGCERYIDTPVKRYSSGMMVRLGFAVAAHLDPEILVVDEVLAVGDAEFQKKAIGKMQDVSRGEGRTVLFVSHNMDSILNLCHNGILLENGSMKYAGDIQSTVSQYLSASNAQTKFIKKDSSNVVYLSEALLQGNREQQRGLFYFDDDITLSLQFKKQKGSIVDNNTKVAVWIISAKNVKVSITELSLDSLQTLDTVSFILKYPKAILMPGSYLVQIDVHVPNVCFYDRQEPISFTIHDNGSEFLKYNGINLGLVSFRPQIELV